MKKPLVLFFALLLIHLLPAQPTIGLLKNDGGAASGYILFAPLHATTTYLIDRNGRQVHSWTSRYKPGQAAYLLPNGHLLRCANDSNQFFFSSAGRIEEFDWDGRLVWSYVISTPTSCLHHDLWPMPNGNILALLWEKKTPEEVKAMGRNPELLGKSIWMEKIVELKPKGKDAADIVWQWCVWDHLVQDRDPSLPNYGDVAKNPQLLNINYKAKNDEDWLHFNSVTFNPALNQVMVSNRNLCELYIIDHSTSTAKAASHRGGRSKKGGDILYRWGNPAAYNCGTAGGQQFYWQHSAHWIADGLVDAGKIMVFNNGTMRPGETPYSSVEIIAPPVDGEVNYTTVPGLAFLPEAPAWTTKTVMQEPFYSLNVSNAQRLPNGNTLICAGASGHFFEIAPSGRIIWSYVNPLTVKGLALQGTTLLENQVFRCLFYAPDYPAFKHKKLTPGETIEQASDVNRK